ncbi:MAG: MBL fold metallo-hydrolase [Endomicrobia bacterium]|nr:MBL fold metallo-hydrolase [Endomicrobiia bacterium]MCL2798720.1 MBL fold metallo-hydrolase [Endomicrobiia bacterium]
MRKVLFASVLALFCFCVSGFSQDSNEVSSEGFKIYKIGSIDFIAFKDLDTNMGKSILLKPDSEIVKKLMPDDQNPSSINAFVVKTGSKIVLIDTGVGAGGNLIKNLAAAGISPEQVDIVLITHMHGDHVGGLIKSGNQKAFPSATVYVAKPEIDYWTANISSNIKNSDLARAVKAVYGDKFKTFTWEDGGDIIAGIKTVKAQGHTPGHTAFEISSDGEKLIVIGDLIHSLNVQMADPRLAVTFDVDPIQAVDTRKRILKDAARATTRIAGMHIPFPGVGTVTEKDDGGYFFNPTLK